MSFLLLVFLTCDSLKWNGVYTASHGMAALMITPGIDQFEIEFQLALIDELGFDVGEC